MSAAPRPYRRPSRCVGTKGSLVQCSSGPVGTTSVWPAKTRVGPGRPPRRSAHRLLTRASSGPASSVSQAKPAARQALGQQRLAAGVVGRDRAAGDQRLGRRSVSVMRRAGHLRVSQGARRGGRRVLGPHVERDLGEDGARRLRPSLGAARRDDRRRASFCSRHIRLVGESAWARPSSRDDHALGDQARDVLLEGLRALGHRLLHRLLDAGEVALARSARTPAWCSAAPRPPARGRRRWRAAGAARRWRAGRRPGRTAASGAPRACRSDRMRPSAW